MIATHQNNLPPKTPPSQADVDPLSATPTVRAKRHFELAASPSCFHPGCNSRATKASIVTGEHWFTCGNGHVNVETLCTHMEAA